MKILSIVGARPNFMKIAPFIRAISDWNSVHDSKIEHILVHTGQHYDDRMSAAFFQALDIPAADINLGIGSGSHAEQVGRTMIAFEQVLLSQQPDWVVVVGDVNATLACSVTAKKMHIKVCHIEAGLRSGDLTMPEEINRLVTDRIADLLLAPDAISVQNLKNEGVCDKAICLCGNIMIDTLDAQRDKAMSLTLSEIFGNNAINNVEVQKVGSFSETFGVVTLHRPSNVDDFEILSRLVNFFIKEVSHELPLVWPVHPRTVKQMAETGLLQNLMDCPSVLLLQPLGYHQMLRLNLGAALFFTDSGGLQEECTVIGTPCITLRNNTERPVTLKSHGGVSLLVGNSIETIRLAYAQAKQAGKMPVRPEMWDGQAAKRMVEAIMSFVAS